MRLTLSRGRDVHDTTLMISRDEVDVADAVIPLEKYLPYTRRAEERVSLDLGVLEIDFVKGNKCNALPPINCASVVPNPSELALKKERRRRTWNDLDNIQR